MVPELLQLIGQATLSTVKYQSLNYNKRRFVFRYAFFFLLVTCDNHKNKPAESCKNQHNYPVYSFAKAMKR